MSDTPKNAFLEYLDGWLSGWNRFWFKPADPIVLSALRIPVGLMLFYTHLVWTWDLEAFFGSEGVFSERYLETFNNHSPFAWSHFFWFDSPAWTWGSHIVCLLILAAFTLGFKTRITSILSFLVVVSYANRAPGALFGLDQINAFMALYMAVGPSGAMFSLDRWLAKRKGGGLIKPMVSANLGIRLIQVHLCIVYLFAGLGKLQGNLWWNGEALWGAFASYDYQTIDMTFLVHAPFLIHFLTHLTIVWEAGYAFLVWPRLTRPIMVFLSIPVHLGIGLCMGMMTFGTIMILANVSFVSPRLLRRFFPN